ncbi:MAG: DEAD/DEAH box helicase [Cellvibrionales bacterium]|nr:DEAD/DEAH box helicase [Cellvibrionales bacterium]
MPNREHSHRETMSSKSPETFAELNLPEPILSAITAVGYEKPSPIQGEAIPYLLEGHDLLGVAQTGTGKTAAFALPLLARLQLPSKTTQILCLAPTRELAIQVAEAFNSYAKNLKGFHAAAIYGGQSYSVQMRALKKGPQVIIGTPGRVMDHMRKGSLKLDKLEALVLDEADEMLRMGFIDDVEWVLEQTPDSRQIALFSATMPKEIKRIAKTHLNEPKEVTIKVKTTTAESIVQRYWQLNNNEKFDTLVRVLEAEEHDGVIIFSRTKNGTMEIAEKLQAAGYAADALNGDMQQTAREKCIARLKNGQLNILVATDVAARGLDVDRISHVINFDIPYDTESYVHRIGRTGRAGRTGEAILFVTNREKRLLQAIEKATNQRIGKYKFPSTEELTAKKKQAFFETLDDALKADTTEYDYLLKEFIAGGDPVSHEKLAATLAYLLHDKKPFAVKEPPKPKEKRERKKSNASKEKPSRGNERRDNKSSNRKPRKRKAMEEDVPMITCRIEVGNDDGVKKSNIVGAIANECDLDSAYIGKIIIKDDHSFVDLPEGMPKSVQKHMKKIRVCGKPMQLTIKK